MRTGFLGAVAAVGITPLVAGVRPVEPLMHDNVEKGKSPLIATFQSSLAAILATSQGLSNATEHGSAISTEKSCDGMQDHEAVVEMFSDDKCSTDSLYSHVVVPVNKQCIHMGPVSAKFDCETKKITTFLDPECKQVIITENMDECIDKHGGSFGKVSCIDSTERMFEMEVYEGKSCDKMIVSFAMMDTHAECFRNGRLMNGKVQAASEKFTVEGDKLVYRKWDGVFDCSGDPTKEEDEKIVCGECLDEGELISRKFVHCSPKILEQVKKSGSVATSWNAVIGMSVLLITTLLIQQ